MTTSKTTSLETVKALIQIMNDNNLASLKCGDVELVARPRTSSIMTPTPPVKKELTPEEILNMDSKDLAELVTWSSGGDEETVLKLLKSRGQS